MSIESVPPSTHLILRHPLLLLPSVFSSIRVFSSGSALHIRWPKYWSFSFNISPSKEHPDRSPLGWNGLISLQSKGLSEPSPEPQFESINSSACLQCGFWTVRYQLPYLQENSKHLDVEISGPIFMWWPWHWADTATYTECKKVFVELSRRATSVVTDKRLYYKMRNSVTRCRKPHGINSC